MKGGTYAIEELSKALSATAGNDKLPDGLSRTAVAICAKQVCLHSGVCLIHLTQRSFLTLNIFVFQAFSEL